MEKPKEKEISLKSTKNELLDAYNELLTKVKDEKSDDRKINKQKADEDKIINSASQNSTEKIIKDLGETKLTISRSLDELGEKLVSEYKKLTDLQNAINIEKSYLDEIYQIKIEADSLAALLGAQKEKKIEFENEIEKKKLDFEEEMIQKRLQWKTEQDAFEAARKERDSQLKKERIREEEEYNYNQLLTRKKDNDEYNEKKITLEKNFNEREAAIAQREKEYLELNVKVETFVTELQKAQEDVKNAVTAELETKHKFQADLLNKELDGERKLNKQIITSLENKIKEQEIQIKKLSERADDSISQVHSIAMKAVEGSQKGFTGSNSDKSPDVSKS